MCNTFQVMLFKDGESSYNSQNWDLPILKNGNGWFLWDTQSAQGPAFDVGAVTIITFQMENWGMKSMVICPKLPRSEHRTLTVWLQNPCSLPLHLRFWFKIGLLKKKKRSYCSSQPYGQLWCEVFTIQQYSNRFLSLLIGYIVMIDS